MIQYFLEKNHLIAIDFFSRGQFVAKILLVAEGLEWILVNLMLNPNEATRWLMPQQKTE